MENQTIYSTTIPTVIDQYGNAFTEYEASEFTVIIFDKNVVADAGIADEDSPENINIEKGLFYAKVADNAKAGQSTMATITVNESDKSASLTLQVNAPITPTEIELVNAENLISKMVVGSSQNITFRVNANNGRTYGGSDVNAVINCTPEGVVSIVPATGKTDNNGLVTFTVNAEKAGDGDFKVYLDFNDNTIESELINIQVYED